VFQIKVLHPDGVYSFMPYATFLYGEPFFFFFFRKWIEFDLSVMYNILYVELIQTEMKLA